MIEYISGRMTQLTPAYAVLEAGGIGYMINISLTAYSELQGKENVKLLIHEVIREDARLLFGFTDETERRLFRQLLGVSGVGASTARIIISSIPAPELEYVIASGDHNRLKTVKGIGAKTAQRIIVDLKDKIKPADDTLFLLQPSASAENAAYEEAFAALVALEFPRAAVQKALKAIFKADPASTTE
ncbi:MAG: Holliday junction branch migration protein RuvA, partial [Muribaculaceae bacterium]|nr:Holliday junction branch migration protein RuvA [Muribaculaceae bacterium]